MDEKKILLINLSKGKIGEALRFLGLILVPKILVAAMSRQDTPIDQRPDFLFVLMSFQKFLQLLILRKFFLEARKY